MAQSNAAIVQQQPLLSDFIGLYKSVLTKEECKEIIQFFENCHTAGLTNVGATVSGQSNPQVKDSIDLQLMNEALNLPSGYQWACHPEKHEKISNLLRKQFKNICADYLQGWVDAVVSVNPDNPPCSMTEGPVYLSSIQIQKYPKGSKGYPAIHCEADNHLMYRRILAPILYLNDVTDGGCTEITLANVTIPPVAGNAMVIPSQPPWYHRGLPSKTQDKYIITTWLEWMPEQGMLELINREENTNAS